MVDQRTADRTAVAAARTFDFVGFICLFLTFETVRNFDFGKLFFGDFGMN